MSDELIHVRLGRMTHPIRVLPESHTDHGLTEEQLTAALELAASAGGFDEGYFDHPHVVVQTVLLPPHVESPLHALYGPLCGDEPVPDARTHLEPRGSRSWPSRLVRWPTRPTRAVTVVTGPHGDEPLVLHTAYPGPAAPREPGDPSIASDPQALAESRAFWADHALAELG